MPATGDASSVKPGRRVGVPSHARAARCHVLCGLVCLAAVHVLAGCHAGPSRAPVGPMSVTFLDYGEVARRHNARLAGVERLWARAVVEMRWTEPDGKRRYEQGDGNLIARLPDDLALGIGKLGNTRLWLGANGARYWLLDLSGDQRVAYVGEANAGVSGVQAGPGAGPLPVRPDAIVGLLGIGRLDPADDAVAARVDGRIVATLPAVMDEAQGAVRPARELGFDAEGRLDRITVIDREGQAILQVTLEQFKPMPLTGKAPGAWPDVARRMRLVVGPQTEEPARIDLNLEDLTDNPDKFKDAQFDLGRLVDALQIDRIEPLGRDPDTVR